MRRGPMEKWNTALAWIILAESVALGGLMLLVL
jgi:hypothetical protein